MNSRFFLVVSLLSIAFSPLAAQMQEREFVTVYGSQIPELDPQKAIFSNEAQIHSAMYEGLFIYDPQTLEPLRAMAQSWERSVDKKLYRFTIREDAIWSDGSPITAQDFVRSWFRMLDINAEYATFFDIIEGAKQYRMGLDKNPEHVGIKAVSANVLEIALVRPVAYLTRLLCHHSFSVIHPSMIDKEDWRSAIPYPVNGPYKPVSITETELVLEKNEAYWDSENVSIPMLRMMFTDDDELATSLFNTGYVHWLDGPGNYEKVLLQTAIQVFPIYSTHYWFFNCRSEPWNDKRVRRALALLLPWDSIRSSEFYMLPAKTLVLPLPGYSKVKGIEKSDSTEAMKLLEEAGYPKGQGLPEIIIAFADYERPNLIANTLKTEWEKALDVEVTLQPMQASSYYDSIGNRSDAWSFTVAHETWIGDFADPEAFLQMWASDAPLNIAGYNDSAYMDFLIQSYDASDNDRMNILAKAETELLKGAACLPIYHNFAASVIDIDFIQGWYQNALDIHPYKYLRFGTPSISPNVAKASSSYISLR